jgi:glucose/arabinose dehydrogenase
MRKKLLISTAALLAGVALASAQSMQGGGEQRGGAAQGQQSQSSPQQGQSQQAPQVMRHFLCVRGRRGARAVACTTTIALLAVSPSAAKDAGRTAAAAAQACASDNGGITLPPGFCATVFADKIGHARQMVVAPNGVVYVNTWIGGFYSKDTPPPGGFLLALQDTKGDGRADVVVRFGPDAKSGNAGGTGIALYKGALYAETNDRIVRYTLLADTVGPSGPPEVIVYGLPLTGIHPMHPFKIDAQGSLYVDLGAATNSCEFGPYSRGIEPCPELTTHGGIWRYDANRTGQQFSPTERFATGLRNGEGIAFDAAGRIFATQHGRDHLEFWRRLYTPMQGANEPAEELVQLERGADYGWPYCYFDLGQHKLVLAPEYGGDGKRVGLCADKRAPIAAFPAHWAPNDLLLYDGHQFPAAYQGGAFIAFHGSGAPVRGGYNVVFQPLANGKASGPFVVFADGFAGAVKLPDRAAHRPSGLAVGPDGALYISDDSRGRIWRVTYRGPATAAVTAAAAPRRAHRQLGAQSGCSEARYSSRCRFAGGGRGSAAKCTSSRARSPASSGSIRATRRPGACAHAAARRAAPGPSS